MKKIVLLICFSCTSLLTVCAANELLPPVGPAPGPQTTAPPESGVLVVYSAWSANNNYGASNHSGYSIHSNDGKLVNYVPNAIEGDYTREPPARVTLPAGAYKIKAESSVYGWVVVSVVIKRGQTTPVYLDGERHPIDSLTNANIVVKLPDGEIVGWAADLSSY
jgi:hypothetical protein